MPDSHSSKVFLLTKENIHAIPILHHTMEMAALVKTAFDCLKPDCVVVELPETFQTEFIHSASRLPDITIVVSSQTEAPGLAVKDGDQPIYFLCEPCDPLFEGLRSALEHGIPAYCIDLDVNMYPEIPEYLPDPYAIQRIGLKHYYENYKKHCLEVKHVITPEDRARELYMAKRLKELSFSYERILFISGMSHTERILQLVQSSTFPQFEHAKHAKAHLCTLTEKSCREVLPEFGWVVQNYEEFRSIPNKSNSSFPDRQKFLYYLLKKASEKYTKATGFEFKSYHLRNIMKFMRNYALITERLMPDLFQLLSSAKGCVDHNYAYEVWELATEYPYLKNIDNLPCLNLAIEDLWKKRKTIHFHRKQQNLKSLRFQKRKKNHDYFKLHPPGPFTICSYPKEDLLVENFGEFLKKKSIQISSEEAAKTVPFTCSLEDGIDIRETIRHWFEHTLYVKTRGKPAGKASSVVVIFDEDANKENQSCNEKYPWKATWIGEHNQESDMALYATDMRKEVVGPGISRCLYGGFMMSSPPRRLFDIWSDRDYLDCKSKADHLLMAAIDYAVETIIVYVAERPPKAYLKNYAARFGRKIIYIPIGQLSPVLLNKIRVFHVLDGQDKRAIADEYIF